MKMLMSRINARITPDQHRRIQRIDAEDFDLVMLKVAEDLAATGKVVTRDYLERGIFALKQYYAVAMLDPANAHSITRPIDPFWHAHILCTAEYRKFCDDVVGEYMDHVPLDKRNPNKVKNVRQLYAYTIKIIPRLFLDIDLDFWPEASSDDDLICYHKGNQQIYRDLQRDRLFAPTPEGVAWAFGH